MDRDIDEIVVMHLGWSLPLSEEQRRQIDVIKRSSYQRYAALIGLADTPIFVERHEAERGR